MGKAYKLKLVIKLQAKYTGYHAAYIYVSSWEWQRKQMSDI